MLSYECIIIKFGLNFCSRSSGICPSIQMGMSNKERMRFAIAKDIKAVAAVVG